MNSILFAHADYIFALAEYIISTVEYMFALGNKDFFIINKLLTYYNIYIYTEDIFFLFLWMLPLPETSGSINLNY